MRRAAIPGEGVGAADQGSGFMDYGDYGSGLEAQGFLQLEAVSTERDAGSPAKAPQQDASQERLRTSAFGLSRMPQSTCTQINALDRPSFGNRKA